MSRPPLPPFDAVSAAQKARMAEDAWNSRDPERVALAYTPDTHSAVRLIWSHRLPPRSVVEQAASAGSGQIERTSAHRHIPALGISD